MAASPYSVTTFETCESSETPIAVTSRTRALWVRFKTDGSHTARGFSIPYVSYSGMSQATAPLTLSFDLYLDFDLDILSVSSTS